MKKSFRDAWLSALRFGEYLQGQQYLCDRGKHCCLGVAYRVDPEPPRIEETEDGLVFFNGKRAHPADKDLDRWGLSYCDARTLAQMNDKGASFPLIADYIETHIPADDEDTP